MKKSLFFVLVFLWVGTNWMDSVSGQEKKKGGMVKGAIQVAMMSVEVTDLSPEIGEEVKSTAIAELQEIGLFRVVPDKQVQTVLNLLTKKKLYKPNCTEDTKCIKTVASRLKAKALYTILVAKSQEGITLSMRTFDALSGKQIRQETEFSKEGPEELNQATLWLTRRASSPMITTVAKGKGKLRVETKEEGADLYINNKLFGKKTGKGFKVTAGVFDIVVKKEGFVPFHDVVVVKPNLEQVVEAELRKESTTTTSQVAVIPEIKPEEKISEPEKKDVPAWAVFESPTAKPEEKKDIPSPGEEKVALKTEEKLPEKQPYLPEQKPEEPQWEEKPQKQFYQTWWFWTIVGVAVAGGVGAGVGIALSSSGGGEDAGVGSATITWQ